MRFKFWTDGDFDNFLDDVADLVADAEQVVEANYASRTVTIPLYIYDHYQHELDRLADDHGGDWA